MRDDSGERFFFVLKASGVAAFFGVFLMLVVPVMVDEIDPVNSTDDSRRKGSGLWLHVDALTGCHYLSTFFGGPTPRLDAEGNHVCTGREP